MSSRFISAVALYGPKAEPVRSMLAGIQSTVRSHIGDDHFQPYSLEQMHGTLIALDGTRDADGSVVNDYFLEYAGERRPMDISLAMEILTEFFATPLRVQVGGYRHNDPVPFLSRGQHLHDRTFSVQADAFVLIGWPTSPGLPLDKLRRDLNVAGLLHRYHREPADIDGDLHIVIGHHRGASPDELRHAVRTIRDGLAATPVAFHISASDIRVVAADSHTLASAQLAAPIPADADIIRPFIVES